MGRAVRGSGATRQGGQEAGRDGFSGWLDFGNDDELGLIFADNYNQETTGTTKAQSAQRRYKIISVTNPISSIIARLFARRARSHMRSRELEAGRARSKWDLESFC